MGGVKGVLTNANLQFGGEAFCWEMGGVHWNPPQAEEETEPRFEFWGILSFTFLVYSLQTLHMNVESLILLL